MGIERRCRNTREGLRVVTASGVSRCREGPQSHRLGSTISDPKGSKYPIIRSPLEGSIGVYRRMQGLGFRVQVPK